MTCILGFRAGEVAVLGADRRSTFGGTPLTDGAQKLVTAGEWTIGTAGSARYKQVLARNIAALATAPTIDDLATVLRDALIADGWKPKADPDGGPDCYGHSAAVTRAGRLWLVGSDFGIAEIEAGEFVGFGSGCDYALGAGEALKRTGLAPADVIRGAIAIACKFEPSCGGEPLLAVTYAATQAGDEGEGRLAAGISPPPYQEALPS